MSSTAQKREAGAAERIHGSFDGFLFVTSEEIRTDMGLHHTRKYNSTN